MLVSFVLTPISYRGYVYTSLDSKHCYYYLGSRFYSPLLSRFMNADSIPDTGTGVVGTNMFAYCNNSPIGFIDPDGEKPRGNIVTTLEKIVNAFKTLLKIAAKVIMFVYDEKGRDFNTQANWMERTYYKRSDVTKIKVWKKNDFVKMWNSIKEPVNEIFLFLHGQSSRLVFEKLKESDKDDSPERYLEVEEMQRRLCSLNVLSRVCLLSCYGGSRNGNRYSVAEVLAYKCIGVPVRSVENGNVTYRDYDQLFGRRPLTKEGVWVDFMYKNGRYSKTTYNEIKFMPMI